MSYAHRLPYAAAKAVRHVYNRGCVYVQSICESNREITLCVFAPSCLCVESFPIRVRLWISHAAGSFPGDAAAYCVECAGLYGNTDPDPVAHADDYANANGNTNPDAVANIDGHTITDTDIDTQPATVAHLTTADPDSGHQ